ncbi:response regulator [Geosporobacter ferrireducens]|uniref:Stage 0 sporulation protein A homolog n=1 Tax=Geosporobacter ferrireducens TaxID=1424294 RepID=A0A1D8GCF2_9FIRM|nr:response regulator [Geosporobacter ferrireducens]AOT68581.1 response regulator receiver protein [Geosporobacter ferrireducens]MTI54050.1 response regulator [Geosporobacter ferrireducens]
MSNTFLIIDDDMNIRKMLKQIVLKNNFGRIVAELSSGEHAVEEINFYNPDIVLIDLLLPVKDGIDIIDQTIAQGFTGKFIMISQVENEHMVSSAYEKGIMFFIHKPINMLEAIHVIKMVSQNIELERSVNLIKNVLSGIDSSSTSTNVSSIEDGIRNVLTDIGIISEAGSKDLITVIHRIILHKKKNPLISYQLQDIYQQIANEDANTKDVKASARTLEQRIRRTILKAMENISQLGLDDYYNPKFTEYSSRLFELKQVKQEMRYIENPAEERGKINIKRFVEGVISQINF